MNQQKARKIVKYLVKQMQLRPESWAAWQSIPPTAQAELRTEWAGIIMTFASEEKRCEN